MRLIDGLMLGVLALQGTRGRMHKQVTLFEVPNDVETYTPITTANIEDRAFKVIELRNEPMSSAVLSLIKDTDQSLDPKRIRLKIVTENSSYVFDLNGVGRSSSGKAVRIDTKQLAVVLCE